MASGYRSIQLVSLYDGWVEIGYSMRSRFMSSKNSRLYIWIGVLLVISWSSLAFVNPYSAGAVGIIRISYIFGMLFAHTTIAATWMAFGPGKFLLRIPLSLIWTASLVLPIHQSIGLHGGEERSFVIGVFGQWLLLQFPLWGLAIGLRLRLRHQSETEINETQQFRFGIVHLIVITARGIYLDFEEINGSRSLASYA